MAEEATSWHARSPGEVVAELESNLEEGLTQREAEARLDQYGPNTLAQGRIVRWYEVLGRQFMDALIGILVVAGIISIFVGEVSDAITIFAIIVLNGILGFVQEWRAEKALEALKEMLSPHTKVIRDGAPHDIDASELVPGDVVRLDTGDRVPGDARLIESVNLTIDESALTGESEPVDKQVEAVDESEPLSSRKSMAWTGTAVTSGHAIAVVVQTGMKTEFGRIADLTQNVERSETQLQKQLSTLGKWLGVVAVVVSVLIALIGIAVGREAIEMFMVGVAMAVATVPEGLPAVVTITLALGVRQMLKRKALIRRLQAAETLGAATVICTDKTGTLTKNEMTVQSVWTADASFDVHGVGYAPQGDIELDGQQVDPGDHLTLELLLECGARCNNSKLAEEDDGWHALGAPTEAALLTVARKVGIDPGKLERELVREIPFDSTRKRMSVLERHGGELRVFAKGAPEVILERCTHVQYDDGPREIDEEQKQAALDALEDQATQGRRTLALAWKPVDDEIDHENMEQGLRLLGIVGIVDPPRENVDRAITQAKMAGIDTIMITGDAAPTALAIAQAIGMQVDRALQGPEVDSLSDQELADVLANERVLFARVTPEHKLRIVEALQSQGEVVAMTGDGVNDAPALKRADIGVSMGLRGTEVARSASDMVLTDDNFNSIVGAVEEGRRQYDNIQKFVRYLLSSNFGEVVAITVSIAVGGPLILLPVQILWANLITDGVTAVALGAEPVEENTMKRSPRDPRARILDLKGILSILILGAYLGGATYGVFHYYLQGDAEAVARAQTMAFTGLIMFEKINVFNFRSLHSSLFSIGVFSNPWVIAAWFFNLLLQICAVYVPFMQDLLHTVPLTLQDWLLIFAVGLPIFIAGEITKWVWERFFEEGAH